MWQRLWALVLKEFLATLKDNKSRGVLLVLPLIQLLVFPHAATLDVNSVRVAVFNEDAGRFGRDLIARFSAAAGFRVVDNLASTDEIEQVIAGGRADLVIHIGQEFSEALARRASAPVQLLVDGRSSNTALIILDYGSRIISAFNQEIGVPQPPATLVERAWFNPNLLSLWSILPGLLAIITLVATMSITGFSVAREKEIGTFQQLLVTPLRPWEIVVGKTAPALILGLAESLLIVATAVYLYRVPLTGNPWLLLAGLLLYLLASIGIGLAISAFARTQQQALLGGFFFIVPVVILSGFATPIANMPDWVQTLTHVNPMRYFLVISRGIFLKDLPAEAVFAQLWPMAVIAAVNLTVAAWLFRKRLY